MRRAGFNRWLVPPAALCIHLCIGMAYGFSVFWKPLQGALLGADGKALPECSAGAVTFAEKAAGTLKALTATDCNWSQFDLGWMYTFFFVLLGVSAAIWGGWLERAGPRKAGVVSALCWCGGLLISALGVYLASAVDAVARLRHHRRRRPRPRLHLARLHADQMVPRPARHGDRHGHHGLRRRRHDRLAAGDDPDEPVQDRDRSRRLADVRRHGRHLLRVHADRRVRLSSAAGGLEAGRLDAARGEQRHDHVDERAFEERAQDAAVLAAVDHPVHERLGRHRHHRCSLAHAAGNLRRRAHRQGRRRLSRREEGRSAACGRRGGRRRLRRPDLALQYFRPHRLGLILRRSSGAR